VWFSPPFLVILFRGYFFLHFFYMLLSPSHDSLLLVWCLMLQQSLLYTVPTQSLETRRVFPHF
jgi:hypothetical protein